MTTHNRSFDLLLKLISITLFPVLEAKVEVLPEVIGHLGGEVILSCWLIQTQNENLTQVQWNFQQPEGNKTKILVFDSKFGLDIKDSPLKERVNISGLSLKIKDVKKSDEGSYTCHVATFPSGSFEGTTRLIVSESPVLLRAEIVAAVIIASMLLLMILTTVSYLTFMKRSQSARRLQVLIDTSGQVASVNRPSFIEKEKDVVYSAVKPKRSRESDEKLTVQLDDVTYSEVKILHKRPK